MNATMPIRCQCGTLVVLEGEAVGLFSDTFCLTCSAAIWPGGDGQVRTRILRRAWRELQSGDFVLSIIFAAVAVECELGRTFAKWKTIESGLIAEHPSGFQENQWVSTFRYGVKESLNRVCDFLTGQSFDAFVNSQSGLAKSVHERHPASVSAKSLRQFFNNNLFWKRAEIVHRGRTDFASEHAEEAFRSALTLFCIISEMEFNRRRNTEQNLRKPRSD